MNSTLVPYSEPMRTTMIRTGAIAIAMGTIASVATHHRLSWPTAVLLALWPSFGGHWIELWYLNWLRPRIASSRMVHAMTRVAVWFIGGVALFALIRVTTLLFGGPAVAWRNIWLGGLVFIAIELVAHGALASRHRPNFYNGLA